MILLINNYIPPNDNDDLSFVPKIRKALKHFNIPFYEVKKVQVIPDDICDKIKGIIISGSKLRLSKPLLFDDFAYILYYIMKFDDIPVLGLCFGCQILHVLNGGKLEDQIQLSCHEYLTELSEDIHPLFQNVSFLKKEDTFHRFSVCFHDLPLGFPKSSHVKYIAFFHHREKKIPCAYEYSSNRFGMMIHPEMNKETYIVFRNFADICKI
jgi:GMP synthase-like glutamine amidotransferase